MSENELHVIVGTGPLGLAVMDELLAKGKQVRLVNRSGEGNFSEEVDVVKANVTNLEEFNAACKDAAVIYNCTNAPYTKWKEILPVMMDGLIQVGEATGARLVHADNLYMYGLVHAELTEELPDHSTENKGQARAIIAKTLMESHREGRVEATIGRAANFYGPRVLDSVVGEGVFTAALSGKSAQVLGNPKTLHTYTYIRDFAKGLVTLGERDEALGEVWHIPSGRTITTTEFVSEVFEQIGMPLKIKTAPKLGIQFLSLFNPVMRETKAILYQFENPFVVNHEKYEHIFGAEPTDHQEAISETIAWYREYLGGGI